MFPDMAFYSQSGSFHPGVYLNTSKLFGKLEKKLRVGWCRSKVVMADGQSTMK